jgi:integrative and conjugative element protein (TIGR02256 family)
LQATDSLAEEGLMGKCAEIEGVEPPSLVFANPLVEGGLVLFESAALAVIARHRQLKAGLPESGGILLGCRRGPHLHVIHATQSGSADRATRVSFVRRDPCHQAQALRIWKGSRHTVDYLGEWHTHPEGMPSPSSTDHRAWLEILIASTSQYVFVIAGTAETLWAGCGQQRRLMPLIPIQPMS